MNNSLMNAIATWPSKARTMVSLRHVLILAIAVRLLLPLVAVITTNGNSLFYAPDTNSYIQPAVALFSDGRFAWNGEPEILRTPGYPILLLPGIASGHVETVTIGLQIILSTLTVGLVYGIAMLLFERTEIAILSAVLYAIEPVSIIYSSKLLSETLFTALTALFLYFLLRYWKGGSVTHLVVSAIALAASIYVRPISYYLPILVCIILFVSILEKKRKNSQTLVHLGVFLLTSIGLIGIWQVRNKIETGYSGFASAAEESLFYWDAASVLATVRGVSVQETREQMGFKNEEIYFRNFPEQRGLERSEILRSMGRQGVEIILSNAGVYSKLASRGAFRTLLDPGAAEYLSILGPYPYPDGLHALMDEQGLVKAVGFLFDETPTVFWANLLLGLVLVSYLLLALLGVVQSRMILSLPMMLFSGVTIYFIVLSAAGIGSSRARHPIIPIICVLAGYGLLVLIDGIRRKWASHQPKFEWTWPRRIAGWLRIDASHGSIWNWGG